MRVDDCNERKQNEPEDKRAPRMRSMNTILGDPTGRSALREFKRVARYQ
jgi:hypothetical protein